MPEVTVTQRPAVCVLGLLERLNPMEADYTAVWSRFHERYEEVKPLALEEAAYGVYYDTGEPNMADHLGGMPVGALNDLPTGMVLRELPAGTYAVTECPLNAIGPAWNLLGSAWLPESGMEYDKERPAFEYFPAGCHTGEANVQVCMPVRPRA